METGKFIKQKRIDLGLSQVEAARRFGFGTPQHLCNIERGACMPPLKKMRRIAMGLRIDIEELVEVYIGDVREVIDANL